MITISAFSVPAYEPAGSFKPATEGMVNENVVFKLGTLSCTLLTDSKRIFEHSAPGTAPEGALPIDRLQAVPVLELPLPPLFEAT